MSGKGRRPKSRHDLNASRAKHILPGPFLWHCRNTRPRSQRQFSRQLTGITYDTSTCARCGEEVPTYRVEKGLCPECLPLGGAA